VVKTTFLFDGGGILASHASCFTTVELINAVLSPEHLQSYYQDPDLLLVNAKKLAKANWAKQYGPFQKFDWNYDWHSDYKRLVNNYIAGKRFNILYELPPVENDEDIPKSGLELRVLERWCNRDAFARLNAEVYAWSYPVADQWELGSLFSQRSAEQIVDTSCGQVVVAVQNIDDFGSAMARLVLPYLFSTFYYLDSGESGLWPKKLIVKKCQRLQCGKVYVKYRKAGQPSTWCSRACGNTQRLRRFRQRKKEGGMLASG